jgi:cysteine sulfinate desulfinase/cysteine desulfurase-like protein
MGVAEELARGAVRVSLGPTTREDEIECFLKAWARLAEGLYRAKKQRDIAA